MAAVRTQNRLGRNRETLHIRALSSRLALPKNRIGFWASDWFLCQVIG